MRRTHVLKHANMKKLSLGLALLIAGISTLLANGGAWQTGIPGTGSASASDKVAKLTSRLRMKI